MSDAFLDRIRTIARANPLARNVLLCILSFLWVTTIGGVIATRSVGSVPLRVLLLVGAAISAALVVSYLFLLHAGAATFYYRVLLPIYGYANNPSHRVAHWVWSLLGGSWDQWLDVIFRSQQWNRREHRKTEGIHDGDLFAPRHATRVRPVVIRREHVDSGYVRNERAFSIVLLFNQLRLNRYHSRVALEVDLRGQSCAIYSNRGKGFIRDEFLERDIAENRRVSALSHSFLMGRKAESEYAMSLNAVRWSSGGLLPLANWRGRKWVCLFFRDIEPVGWNIANGASEEKQEYKRISRLIYRELIEELVICRGRPRRCGCVEHRMLELPGLALADLRSRVFDLVREHAALRKQHDELTLSVLANGPALREKPTTQEVRVLFHEGWGDADPEVTRNVLLAINPLELGIEVVRVGEFDLERDAFLIDGEVFSDAQCKYLVRRPLGMISVDYLKSRFAAGRQSLGPGLREYPSDDRKSIGVVPDGDFHLFTEDIRLGLDRLAYLRSSGRADSAEAKRLARWHECAAPWFDAAALRRELAGQLSCLLPAAWKPIELAIAQGII